MNEKGFVNITLIYWMPFILILLFSSFWVLWFLQQKLKVSNLCHQYTLKAQEILVDRNNRIMKLNPRAQWLWGEKKALDLAIIMGPPPVKAAAKIRRKMVVLEQRSIRTAQQGFFKSATWQSRRALVQLRTEFKKQISEWSVFWNDSITIPSSLRIYPKGSQLAVKINDIAPVYQRKPLHWRHQEIKATWTVPIAELMPSWFRKLVPIQQNWLGECHSHPHSGGFKWKAAIGKGNH